jgi:hypothetical protein
MISYTDSEGHAARTVVTRDGRDAAIAAPVPMFSDPDFHADLKRVLADGDYGVIQPIPETAHNDHPLL